METWKIAIVAAVAGIIIFAVGFVAFDISGTQAANVTASSTSITVGQSVTVTCTRAGTGWTPPLYYMIEPDGTGASAQQSAATSATSWSVSWTFSAAGAYTPYCYISDSATGSAGGYGPTITVSSGTTTSTATSQSTSSTSSYPALLVSLSASPVSGNAPLTVSFSCSASGGSGTYSYTLNFGDGTSSSASCFTSHSYSSAGTYAAQLTIQDTAGHTATASQSIIVSTTTTTSTTYAPFSIQILTSPSPASGTAPLSVNFATVASGGSGVYTCNFTYGDGASSNSCNPGTHTYQAGTYLAQVTATDSAGHTSATSVAIQVSNPTSATSTTSVTTQTTQIVTSGSSTYTTVTTFTTYKTIPPSPSALWPSVLKPGWAVGNISVGASQLQVPIYMENMTVSQIQANVQMARVAFNGTIVQLQLAQPGAVTATMLTSRQPVAVYADTNQISSWTFQNGVLTVNADPTYLTIVFQSSSLSSGGAGGFPPSYILATILVVIFGAVAGAVIVSKRS